MKVIAVNGITKSGKTTICETIIKGLCERGYTVGSVKEIHYEQFKIDPIPTTNTNRHKDAGSSLVTARGFYETDILYPQKLNMYEIFKHYNQDFVILEGVTEIDVPKIITAHSLEEVQERLDNRAFLVSGVIANDGLKELCGLPVVHAFDEGDRLVDLVIENAKDLYSDVQDTFKVDKGLCVSKSTQYEIKKILEKSISDDFIVEIKKKDSNLQLVKLDENNHSLLIEMMDEWTSCESKSAPASIFKGDYNNLAEYRDKIEVKEKRDGLVPDSTYFALDTELNKFVGAVNIRHELNEYLRLVGGHIGDGVRPTMRNRGYGTKIIGLAIDKCRELGISEILITCDKTNVASAKTIVKNAGILENELLYDEIVFQRYWVR